MSVPSALTIGLSPRVHNVIVYTANIDKFVLIINK